MQFSKLLAQLRDIFPKTSAYVLYQTRDVMSWYEGGIFKRIDENRELVELLRRDAPQFLEKNSWVEGWLLSHDNFLFKIAEVAQVVDPPRLRQTPFPRPYPQKELKNDVVTNVSSADY